VELNAIVREYLTNQDYKASASTFDTECRQRGKPNASVASETDKRNQMKAAQLRVGLAFFFFFCCI
jgi:hypothetical protein